MSIDSMMIRPFSSEALWCFIDEFIPRCQNCMRIFSFTGRTPSVLIFIKLKKIKNVMNDNFKNDIEIFVKELMKNLKIDNNDISDNEIMHKFIKNHDTYIKACNKVFPTLIGDDLESKNINIFVMTTLSYLLVDILELIKQQLKSLIIIADKDKITYGSLVKKLCRSINYDDKQSGKIREIFLIDFRNALSHMDYFIEDGYLIFPINTKKTMWNSEQLSKKLQHAKMIFYIIDKIIFKNNIINGNHIYQCKNDSEIITKEEIKKDINKLFYDLKDHDIFKIYSHKFYKRTTMKSVPTYNSHIFQLFKIVLNDKCIQQLNYDELNVFHFKNSVIILNGTIELINKFLREIFIDEKLIDKNKKTLAALIENLCSVLKYDDKQKIKYHEIFLSDFRLAVAHMMYYIEDDHLIFFNKSVKTIWTKKLIQIKSDSMKSIIDTITEFNIKHDLPTQGFTD